MKGHIRKKILLVLASSFLMSGGACWAEELPLNADWKFQFDAADVGIHRGWAAPHFDDSSWQSVRAGESWSAFGYFGYSGVAWYRKRIEIPERFREKFIVFRGVKERGFRNANKVEDDQAFAALRDDSNYEKILAKMREN